MTKFHTIQYKGYNIYYEEPMYRVGNIPLKTFLSFEDAKREIDRVVETLENNLNDLMRLVHQNKPPNEANNKG
jgi:hypothetical protein